MGDTLDVTNWQASADGRYYGYYPSGDAIQGLEYTIPISGSAVWFNGNWDGPFNGTEAEPYNDIQAAFDALTDGVGGEIVVKDGTYNVDSSNRARYMINDRASSGFGAKKSGAGWAASATNRDDMILVRAETPFGARFSYTGAGGFYYSFINLESAQFVSVDGLIFENDETSGLALQNMCNTGDNNYISRCIFKRAADGNDGSWVACNDNSLVEMCAGVGATRYGFRCGDSTAATTNHCYRLCVGRFDTSEFTQPCATFAFYGNNSGTAANDAAFLNCIAIDGQWFDTADANLIKWGGLYLPKNAAQCTINGFLVLNEEARYAGLFAGEQQGEDIVVNDSVIWDITGSANVDGYRCNANGTGNAADSLTVGNVNQNFYYTGNTVTPTNSRANDSLNGTDKSILYQNDGADARYVYGSLGQRFGDAGFDQVTAVPAFPFPYEDTIKSVFTEQIDTAAGHNPAGNVSNRGFCQSTSLTDYIIKYVDPTTTISEVYA